SAVVHPDADNCDASIIDGKLQFPVNTEITFEETGATTDVSNVKWANVLWTVAEGSANITELDGSETGVVVELTGEANDPVRLALENKTSANGLIIIPIPIFPGDDPKDPQDPKDPNDPNGPDPVDPNEPNDPKDPADPSDSPKPPGASGPGGSAGGSDPSSPSGASTSAKSGGTGKYRCFRTGHRRCRTCAAAWRCIVGAARSRKIGSINPWVRASFLGARTPRTTQGEKHAEHDSGGHQY